MWAIKHGGRNILVYGCFSAYGMDPIQGIEGMMDHFMYQNMVGDNATICQMGHSFTNYVKHFTQSMFPVLLSMVEEMF